MAVRMTSTPEHVAVTCVQLPGQETELAHAEMNQTQGGQFCPGPGPFTLVYVAAFTLVYVAVRVVNFVAETVFATDCISEWPDPESGT